MNESIKYTPGNELFRMMPGVLFSLHMMPANVIYNA